MLNKSCNDLNTYELKGYKTREILTASLIMFVSSFFFFTMYYHILYEPFVFDSIFVFFIYIICIFSICICIILIYKAYKIQPVEITDEYLFYAPFRKEKVPISDIKRVIDQDKHLKILLNDGEKFTLQSYVFDNFDKFRLRLKSVLMRKDIPFIEDVLYKEYILDANPKLKYYDRILLLSVIVGGVLWVIFVQLLREQIRDLFPFFILVPVLFCLFLLK